MIEFFFKKRIKRLASDEEIWPLSTPQVRQATNADMQRLLFGWLLALGCHSF